MATTKRTTAPDRLPPHSAECERGVIGCQMIAPNETIGEVQLRIRGDVSAHYDLRHQEIQRAIFELHDAQKPVDTLTVMEKLKAKQLLEQVGGMAYLNECEEIPSAANLSYWLDIVCEKHLLRRALQTAVGFAGEVYESASTVDEIIEKFEREVLALRTVRGNEQKQIKELVNESLADIEAMFQRQGQISGLSTGLADLDQETDGLHPGELTLIAAFPSVGKTSLAMNIAEHIALELGHPVGIFSAEMSGRSLVTRSICSTGRVNLRDVREGKLGETDFPKIHSAATRLANSKIHIDDTSDLTVPQLRTKARRMVQQHGVKLFIADYAQLFNSPGAENRTNEIDQVSKGFKNMGKELGVPVILLSQLTEDAKGGIHLKGARALGEDADNYWRLERPKGSIENPADITEPIDLWIKKQRNGARNICVNLTFLKTFTKFEMRSKMDTEPQVESRYRD